MRCNGQDERYYELEWLRIRFMCDMKDILEHWDTESLKEIYREAGAY